MYYLYTIINNLNFIIMTVGELIDYLSDFNPDSEIRFASQPSWPFEYDIKEAIECDDPESETGYTVYLVEGEQLGYLTDNIGEQIGW